MEIEIKHKYAVALMFSIAMAFLESAVVVYLRYMLYPDGFVFPMRGMAPIILITELGREAATVVMLLAAGMMLAKTKLSRFAWFMFCFAVWDIFYYVFLYVLLGWPQNLFEWDLLFLIPVAWYGPVITPCLVSLSMIALAAVIVGHEHKGAVRRLRKREWGTMLMGCGIILITFMWPFVEYAGRKYGSWQWPGTQELMKAGLTFVPVQYNWPLFFTGFILIVVAIIVYWKRVGNASMVLH
jgi:hypothetical protein